MSRGRTIKTIKNKIVRLLERLKWKGRKSRFSTGYKERQKHSNDKLFPY